MQEPVGCRELLVRSGALVSIEMDEERGRYAVALKDIKEGQIILKARAYCTALFHACRKQACSSCYNFTMKKSALPFSCKACNSVWYCSLACMKDRASYHQQYECRYYKEASKIPSGSQYERWFFKLLDNVCNRGRRHVLEIYERNDVMDICRWVISYCARSLAENDLRKLEVKIDEDIPIPTHSQVLELTDNDQALPALEREQLLYLHRFLSILSSALTGKKKDIRNNAYRPGDSNSLNELPQTLSDLFVWRFSVEEFTRNINIRQSNCFGIWDEGGERLGQSLFPAASFFNHSCASNLNAEMNIHNVDNTAMDSLEQDIQNMNLSQSELSEDLSLFSLSWAVLKEPVKTFTAARDIRKGEDVSHSYIDVSQSLESRQENLLNFYHFTCTCLRCIKEKEQINTGNS